MLHRWIMHGELIDTHKEFFIGINQDVAASGGSLWHDLYFIRNEMLPTFFTNDLAQKILVIGKSFNFLRACVHSGVWEKTTAGKNSSKVIPKTTDSTVNATTAWMSGLVIDQNEQDSKDLVLSNDEFRFTEATLRTFPG